MVGDKWQKGFILKQIVEEAKGLFLPWSTELHSETHGGVIGEGWFTKYSQRESGNFRSQSSLTNTLSSLLQ